LRRQTGDARVDTYSGSVFGFEIREFSTDPGNYGAWLKNADGDEIGTQFRRHEGGS
jgi:hypothetical protein